MSTTSLVVQIGKESACNAGDPASIPGLGISPREGNGNTFQCSCLENSTTEEPGGLQSMESQRVRHNWVTNTIPFLNSLLNLLQYWFCCLCSPFWLPCMWDFSSLMTRDWIHTPELGVQSLNQWTHQGRPVLIFYRCSNKFPQTLWLNRTQNVLPYSSRDQKSKWILPG